MREPPERIERLPEQYFTALLARVAAAAAAEGEPLVDLGRGNPEVGPPAHVVEALAKSAARPDVHGYAPFAGLPKLKEAIAARYADVYGVELDPRREVAIVPGTKTALVEVALAVAERGSTIVLPDPGYADYPSVFADAVGYARRSGAAILHDFAYGDLVFDGRRPVSFLAQEGAREVGVELFSMSKSYGMAGWRPGFVGGNAEFARRINP